MTTSASPTMQMRTVITLVTVLLSFGSSEGASRLARDFGHGWGCKSEYLLFGFGDREDCKLPNRDDAVKFPTPDCARKVEDRHGIVFRNVYSFDQQHFQFPGHATDSFWALAAPSLNMDNRNHHNNKPMEIGLDLPEPYLAGSSFDLLSLQAQCRNYPDPQYHFIHYDGKINCTIHLDCRYSDRASSQPSIDRASATHRFDIIPSKNMLVEDTDTWTLPNIKNVEGPNTFSGLTNFVLTIDEKNDPTGQFAIMVDNVEKPGPKETNTCVNEVSTLAILEESGVEPGGARALFGVNPTGPWV